MRSYRLPTGVEALEYARNNSVNLVLTDVNMPRMDGITLVRELRLLSGYNSRRLLVLTTEAAPEKEDARQTGRRHRLVGEALQSGERLLATIAKVL